MYKQMSPLQLLTLYCALVILPAAVSSCPAVCSCSSNQAEVNCTGRGLTQIPGDIHSNVTKLHLAHNNLAYIDDSHFSHMSGLLELDLSHNNIMNISENAFNYTRKMVKLSLHNNTLEDLPRNLFNNCIFLFNLYLQNNNFSESVFATLSQATWMVQINLSGNKIQYLPYKFLGRSSQLQNLQLDRNEINVIDTNAMLGLKSLIYLSLSFNKIVQIQREMFHPLISLSELVLEHNALICDCDTRKFKDWILNDSGQVIVNQPVMCLDRNSGAEIDIISGDLSNFCMTDERPTCVPNTSPCIRNATIWFFIVVGRHDMSFSLKYHGINDDAIVTSECRMLSKNTTYTWDSRIDRTAVLFTDLDAGTAYSCCSMVQSCDLFQCDHAVTYGSSIQANTKAYIIGICMLLVLLCIAIVFIIYCIYTKIHYRHKTPYGNVHINEKTLSQNTINTGITDTSYPAINIHTNHKQSVVGYNPMNGRPLPNPNRKQRVESTYDHIPAEAIVDTGVANPVHLDNPPNNNSGARSPDTFLVKRTESLNDPLKPDTYLTPTKVEVTKKTRRFVRPRNIQTNIVPDIPRGRSDTLPVFMQKKQGISQVGRAISQPQINYCADEPMDDSLGTISPIDSPNTPPPDLILPPKTRKNTLSELGSLSSIEADDGHFSVPDKNMMSQNNANTSDDVF